jgi:D-erythronate 2-dehydrogenase
MRVVITGGGGFLGSRLCQQLVELAAIAGPSGQQEPIEQIILLDQSFPAAEAGASLSTQSPIQVSQVTCDISDRDSVMDFIGRKPGLAIFHLASMVSGECEHHFDDALRVNLDGGRNIFEAARAADGRPRVVFASSIACFGGDVILDRFGDDSKLLPRTTYGMTKAICELMVNDYSRKGFFDGRSARLPTVIVRPGKPNAAASSWASGMFREPLHGEDCLLPIRRDQRHPMTGYRTVIDSLIHLHEVPEKAMGGDRAYGLPAHQVTPLMAEQVFSQVAQQRGFTAGRLLDAFDAKIQAIVDGWATAIDGQRGEAIGLPKPPSLLEIVHQYMDDYRSNSNDSGSKEVPHS